MIPLTISWMPPFHLEPVISAITCVVNRDVPPPTWAGVRVPSMAFRSLFVPTPDMGG